VVLGLAIGGALEAFAAVRNATVLGLLVGMIGANLVPNHRSCGPRR
jgi:hypothetical protein